MRRPSIPSLALALALSFAPLSGCAIPGANAPAGREAAGDDSYGAAESEEVALYLKDAELRNRSDARGFADKLVADPAPLPEAQQPPPQEQQQVRHVIYSATARLVVVSAPDAARSVQRFAEELGGWLQESDSRSVTVRVPAEHFEGLLARIEALGEVVDRNVRASDVTEQVIELEIRLDNAKRTRDRLLEHLTTSQKMEDTLKIEAELARVTADIELFEGKLRYLRSQVAMSTIRVELNVATRGRPDSLGLPFAWIERLGDGLLAGTVEGRPKPPRLFSGGPRFDPPAEFIRYYSDDHAVEAMNGESLRIKVVEHDNYDKGALAFWAKLARKALVQTRAVAITEERDLGEDRALIRGEREVAGEPHGYLLVLARDKDDVFAFEAWGPSPEFDRRYAELVKSALSLRR